MKKWRQVKSKEMKNTHIDYQPISLDYFLKMELSAGGGGKEIITQDTKLKTVKDVIEFHKNNDVSSQLNPSNWQYYNCMIAEFRKNVGDHHELGWDNLTKKYYDSLKPMTDEEILEFNKKNPESTLFVIVSHSKYLQKVF